MGTVEKIIGIMLSLVALYLVLANSSAFNSIMSGLGKFNIATLGVLQGRKVDAYGVTLGGNSLNASGLTSVGGQIDRFV